MLKEMCGSLQIVLANDESQLTSLLGSYCKWGGFESFRLTHIHVTQ